MAQDTRETNPPRKVGSDAIVSSAVRYRQEVQADRGDARPDLRCSTIGRVINASVACWDSGSRGS
jgi:hypothetical protein